MRRKNVRVLEGVCRGSLRSDRKNLGVKRTRMLVEQGHIAISGLWNDPKLELLGPSTVGRVLHLQAIDPGLISWHLMWSLSNTRSNP